MIFIFTTLCIFLPWTIAEEAVGCVDDMIACTSELQRFGLVCSLGSCQSSSAIGCQCSCEVGEVICTEELQLSGANCIIDSCQPDPSATAVCNDGEVRCTEELQASGMNCVLDSCQPDPSATAVCSDGEVRCTEELQASGMNCILDSCQPDLSATAVCNDGEIRCTEELQGSGMNCILNSCQPDPSATVVCNTGEVRCTDELQASGMHCIINTCQPDTSALSCLVPSRPMCANSNHCILPGCENTCSTGSATTPVCKRCFVCQDINFIPDRHCLNGDTTPECENPRECPMFDCALPTCSLDYEPVLQWGSNSCRKCFKCEPKLKMICTMDAKTCTVGWVTRNPDNGCEFDACPTPNGAGLFDESKAFLFTLVSVFILL